MPNADDNARRVPAAAILAYMTDAFRACGLPDADAKTVAGAMLDADLSGSDAHGIFRLAGYVKQLRSGIFNPRANITVIERSPATALVDGDNGMGHLVMTYAANLAVEIARASGVGWVGIRRSNHSGAGSTYATIPVAHGMVGIYTAVSSSNFMAPWGGAEPLLGTNPIAFAIPAGKDAPVVFDIATSLSSFGNIRLRQVSGEPLEEGWVVHSKTGEPILDPKKVDEGVLLPIGGHKGSGLALMIGLLAGVLNGAAFGRDVRRGAHDARCSRALHVAPVHLLVDPDGEEPIAITPGVEAEPWEARAWIRGQRPIGQDARFYFMNIPAAEFEQLRPAARDLIAATEQAATPPDEG